jgi:hypothetical protein
MTTSSCHHGWFDQKQNGTCRHMKHLYCTLFLTFRAHHAQNLHFRTAGKNVVPSQRAMIKYRWWRYHSQHHPTNKMPAVKETSAVALPWGKMLRIAKKWLRNIWRLFGMICKVLKVELVFCISKLKFHQISAPHSISFCPLVNHHFPHLFDCSRIPSFWEIMLLVTSCYIPCKVYKAVGLKPHLWGIYGPLRDDTDVTDAMEGDFWGVSPPPPTGTWGCIPANW